MKTYSEMERDEKRYEETKRLAEMAWVALLTNGYEDNLSFADTANSAWVAASSMCIETERRRPK